MSGIPAWCRVGQECVCIKRTPWTTLRDGVGDNHHPAFGEVCVITGVSIEMGLLTLELRGYANLMTARHFRPAITQQDDISTHFAQYLNAPHKPVREGV